MSNVQGWPPLDANARLSVESEFCFGCGPHVPCFTECCGKLELLLTPYDVLRLKNRLQLTSEEFLDRYTVMRWRTAHGFPEVLMEMDCASGKRCPFVTPTGCSVYEDRPGACRIYPLGRASTSHVMDGSHREFYFTVREDHCRGFEEKKSWKVSEWLSDQGMEDYNRINDLLMELYVMRNRGKSVEFSPQHLQMFVMSCYNLEKFRQFVFKSRFLDKFELDPEMVAEIEADDTKLLEFAFLWLKFALFREPVLKPKS
ncbi:YkgJ family cysteine cluster protein [Desulfomonile tiedjei]|uniref:Putative Fe-S oxidoreductase n=1 Tax=Desulfomonile tiedjei (strain ATCC 49306 / DSM 6799 / DCB-1) TaxID=706587 RepID=I4CA82_DESTA|nr:YkgJ family cysteine cluster protein [Desulfomonile tiedjei]AFM26473.1 putative Fe-S oxidoreductase [Desulfomonile tiedjei DSM 6799]